MEELVGRLWHQWISRAASTEHERARVHLADVRRAIEVLFKAGGGAPVCRVNASGQQATGGPRSWLQRVAGSAQSSALPSLDEQVLALPESIAVFDSADLNRDLYLWLAVLASRYTDTGQWIADNVCASVNALNAFPGMRSRHERLLQAHMAQRPDLIALKGAALQAESAVQQALASRLTLPYPAWPAAAVRPAQVQPVWLWLSPCATQPHGAPARNPAAPADAAGRDTPKQDTPQDAKRRRAQHTEDASDRNGMMMFFRAESIMSWSEYVKVNRQTDDEDQGDAIRAADDMDTLAIAPDGQASAARVKFDLDLPAASQDDLPLGPGVRLPEWHWKKQALVPDHCAAQLLEARDPAVFQTTPEIRALARRVRRKLEVLRAQPQTQRGQHMGDDLDLDAWVRWRNTPGSEARIYSRRERTERSLACLLLADLSLSTDTWVSNDQRVIDVIRDSLYVFGEALTALGDPFAMLGFSSVRRQHVRMHLIKRFAEPWTAPVHARIGAIKPGYYTRMGAAIRYATRGLQERPERQRLLLLLTDGKPNDLDAYEGRHGLEDTRQAVLEAQAAGLQPFCVTIDDQGHDYLPMLFGQHGYALVHQPQELAARLSTVYATLATSK